MTEEKDNTEGNDPVREALDAHLADISGIISKGLEEWGAATETEALKIAAQNISPIQFIADVKTKLNEIVSAGEIFPSFSRS